MPSSAVTPERAGFSKLRKALSKLTLKAATEERKQARSPRNHHHHHHQQRHYHVATKPPQRGLEPWDVPLPPGISKHRAREYIASTSVALNGKLFLPQYSEIVRNRLFISDHYTGTDPDVLAELRITHVVHVGASQTHARRTIPHIQYHHVVVLAGVNCPLAEIDDAVDFIDDALGDDDSSVLIHCDTGVDWSPSVAIAWLMRNENCTYESAKEIVRRKREVVNPCREIEKSVKEWWALEVTRPLFPPGRGQRVRGHRTHPSRVAVVVNLRDDESLGEVIDIK